MRRSINGILYDTEQATLLGEYSCSDGDIVRFYRGKNRGQCFGVRSPNPRPSWWKRLQLTDFEPMFYELREHEVMDLLVNKLGTVPARVERA